MYCLLLWIIASYCERSTMLWNLEFKFIRHDFVPSLIQFDVLNALFLAKISTATMRCFSLRVKRCAAGQFSTLSFSSNGTRFQITFQAI